MSEHLTRVGETVTTPVHETESMLCDIDDDVFVSAMWLLQMGARDMFAILWRKRDDEGWQLRVMLRVGSETGDPADDRKTPWHMVLEGADEVKAAARADSILEQLGGSIARMRPQWQPQLSRIDIGKWGTEAGEAILRQPWANLCTLAGGELPKA